MTARPLVSVFSGLDGKSKAQVPLPDVFNSPVRLDIVREVHRDIAKNKRQPYAVSPFAGHQTSAESWGTGRAVARIPRVAGGGTHRAGQGAFGNMCRGGRMFAPTKTYRRWHRKVNKNQKRYAVVSALAASASVPLVMARGHKIDKVPEIPLVVSNETIVDIEKTKDAVKLLKKLHAYRDVEKVKNTRKIRAGKGKMRNRRYVKRRGPLIIYDQKTPLVRAFRNLPGVELVSVNRLNLLLLAPGGHLGRFVIWTRGAFERLDALYGTATRKSKEKAGYRLPRPLITNSDLGRLVNADEIQSIVRPIRKAKRFVPHKKNPLRNLGVMLKLNPYALALRRRELRAGEQRRKKKEALAKARAAKTEGAEGAEARPKPTPRPPRKGKQARKQFYQTLFS
jgi:large subunit ribosomal protein L4e